MRSFSKAFASLIAAALATPLAAQEQETEVPPVIGVMTTIPIFWGEPVEHSDAFLVSELRPHWAKPLLEEHYNLLPVDYLAPDSLFLFDGILLAQPRGLSGEENVAIDAYVRGGGRVLLLADPMMTGESLYHIGDRRRPQDVALLSPILARWGLELRFDEAQAQGLIQVDFGGAAIPVNLAGEFAALGDNCILSNDARVARCAVGEGEVLALADAAILDLYGPWDGAESAILTLAAEIFPRFGDGTGIEQQIPLQVGDSWANTPIGNTSSMDEVTILAEESP